MDAATPAGARPASTPPRISFGTGTTIGVGAAGKQVAEDVSELVRAEVALAKAEILGGVKTKLTGFGLFAAAGVLAGIAFLGLLITIGYVLYEVVGLSGWLSALSVTLGLLVIAGVLAGVGKGKAATAVSADTVKANVQSDLAEAKTHLPSKGTS